jgi:hypothetical protein
MMQILLWHWNSPVHCNHAGGGSMGAIALPRTGLGGFLGCGSGEPPSNCVITCYVHQQNYTERAYCMLWKGISCQDTSCKGLMKLVIQHLFRWNNRCITHMVLVHRVLHGNAPEYLGSLTRLSDVPSRLSPRSASSNHLLIPSIRRSTVVVVVVQERFQYLGQLCWTVCPLTLCRLTVCQSFVVDL